MSKKELYVKFYEVVLSLLSTFNIAKSFDNNIYISKLDLLSDSNINSFINGETSLKVINLFNFYNLKFEIHKNTIDKIPDNELYSRLIILFRRDVMLLYTLIDKYKELLDLSELFLFVANLDGYYHEFIFEIKTIDDIINILTNIYLKKIDILLLLS